MALNEFEHVLLGKQYKEADVDHLTIASSEPAAQQPQLRGLAGARRGLDEHHTLLADDLGQPLTGLCSQCDKGAGMHPAHHAFAGVPQQARIIQDCSHTKAQQSAQGHAL